MAVIEVSVPYRHVRDPHAMDKDEASHLIFLQDPKRIFNSNVVLVTTR